MDILDEIRKRLNKKTPGSWGFDRWGNNNIIALDSNQEICSLANNDNDYDGGFIAWATEDITYLLAEVERLQNKINMTNMEIRQCELAWEGYAETASREMANANKLIKLMFAKLKEAEHDNLHGQH